MKLMISDDILSDFLFNNDILDYIFRIHQLCIKKKINAYVYTKSLESILQNGNKSKNRMEILSQYSILEEYLNIYDIVPEDIPAISNLHRRSMGMPDGCDLKNKIVTACAERFHADYILAKDISLFYESSIPAITPTEFYKIIKETLTNH